MPRLPHLDRSPFSPLLIVLLVLRLPARLGCLEQEPTPTSLAGTATSSKPEFFRAKKAHLVIVVVGVTVDESSRYK